MSEQGVIRARSGRLAGGVRLGRRAARWLATRRALRALLAEYDRGGYRISPATLQRLREQARRQAGRADRAAPHSPGDQGQPEGPARVA